MLCLNLGESLLGTLVDAFKMSGKKVVKIGLNFSVKDEVNCLEWKIG